MAVYLDNDHNSHVCLRVCILVEMCRHRGIFSPSMHDIKTMTVDSEMEGLSCLTHILLATPPAFKYITLEDLQETLIVTLNYSPVVWLENMSVANSVGQVLHLAALHGQLPGSWYEVQ